MAAGAKLVVIYPRPLDESAFESEYQNVHLPMVEKKLKGVNRLVATKILSSPQGETRSYRMAELHFSSIEALNECLNSEGAKAVMEHATSISTGGRPILMIAEEETRVYW
jgi:uncharacterized protein (TIGR02118 family)